jgi:hypothetical protein
VSAPDLCGVLSGHEAPTGHPVAPQRHRRHLPYPRPLQGVRQVQNAPATDGPAPYVKIETAPGPTSRPTMNSTTPSSTCWRNRATIHEYGHHVQDVTGIAGRVRQLESSAPGSANAFGVAQELQADCFAGPWVAIGGCSTPHRRSWRLSAPPPCATTGSWRHPVWRWTPNGSTTGQRSNASCGSRRGSRVEIPSRPFDGALAPRER